MAPTAASRNFNHDFFFVVFHFVFKCCKMLGVTGLLMEISKELSLDAGQTESVCTGQRAAGNSAVMETVKSVCCCLADRRVEEDSNTTEQLCSAGEEKPENIILEISIVHMLIILRRGFTYSPTCIFLFNTRQEN